MAISKCEEVYEKAREAYIEASKRLEEEHHSPESRKAMDEARDNLLDARNKKSMDEITLKCMHRAIDDIIDLYDKADTEYETENMKLYIRRSPNKDDPSKPDNYGIEMEAEDKVRRVVFTKFPDGAVSIKRCFDNETMEPVEYPTGNQYIDYYTELMIFLAQLKMKEDIGEQIPVWMFGHIYKVVEAMKKY